MQKSYRLPSGAFFWDQPQKQFFRWVLNTIYVNYGHQGQVTSAITQFLTAENPEIVNPKLQILLGMFFEESNSAFEHWYKLRTLNGTSLPRIPGILHTISQQKQSMDNKRYIRQLSILAIAYKSDYLTPESPDEVLGEALNSHDLLKRILESPTANLD